MTRRGTWAAVAAGWVGVIGGVGWLALRPAGSGSPPTGPEVFWYELPEVRDPLAVSAADAALPADAPVLGVAAGGRHRAYPLAVLSTVRAHVLNDHLGGQPITVTYCDRNDCSKVFGGRTRLAVAGWAGPAGRPGGSLLVRDGPKVYRQDTGERFDGSGERLDLAELPAVRTTWAAWRADHPDTDVSVGE